MRHELPAHHNLEAYLDAYLEAMGIREMGKTPLFRAIGRTGRLGENAMHRTDAWAMIQRRASAIGLRVKIGCHTFRATGITAYLTGGGTLEGHRPWPRMKARAPPNFTTAPATKSRSMKSSGSRFEKAGSSVVRSGTVTRLRFARGPYGSYIIPFEEDAAPM
jgi:hypothetical protein